MEYREELNYKRTRDIQIFDRARVRFREPKLIKLWKLAFAWNKFRINAENRESAVSRISPN